MFLGALAAGLSQGTDAYDKSSWNQLDWAGQQALGRALFGAPPGASPMPGGQTPSPGQPSVPNRPPQAWPEVQGPPQPPQTTGTMFGGLGGWGEGERPIAMGQAPQGPIPPVQPPPGSPSGMPQAGAPPPVQQPGGGPPQQGMPAPGSMGGVHDPIIGKIMAANPGAPPEVLASAYRQYMMMGRSRYGLNPLSLSLRDRQMQLRDRELGLREEELRKRGQPQSAVDRLRASPEARGAMNQAGPAEQPPPEAMQGLKEGFVTTFKNGQKWTLQGGQPVRMDQQQAEPGKYRGPEIPQAQFDQQATSREAIDQRWNAFVKENGREPATDSEIEAVFGQSGLSAMFPDGRSGARGSGVRPRR